MIARLSSPQTIVAALLLLLLAVLPLLTQAFDQRYLLSVGTRIVIWSIAAVSLNMILGYGGLVSFGHAAFFGIGGYGVGLSLYSWGSSWTAIGTGLLVALVTGVALALVIGLVIVLAYALPGPRFQSRNRRSKRSRAAGWMLSSLRCPNARMV